MSFARMISGVLVTRFNIDWITPEASEYLYDRRGLHMRDVHIKPLVVRRPVSTLGYILGVVAKKKDVVPHAC